MDNTFKHLGVTWMSFECHLGVTWVSGVYYLGVTQVAGVTLVSGGHH